MRSHGHRALKILAGVVIGIIVILVCIEIGLRAYISREVKNEVPGASISIGGYPLVFSLPQGSVKTVDLRVPDSVNIRYTDANRRNPVVSGNPESHILLHDLSMSGDTMRAGDIDLHTTLHDDYLLAMIQRTLHESMGADTAATQIIQVTGVHTTSQGTLEVQFTGGVLTLNLTPVVESDGSLSFTAKSSSVFGFSMPDVVTKAFSDAIATGTNQTITDYRFQDVHIEPNAMNVHLTGTNVPLSQLPHEADQKPHHGSAKTT